MQILVATLRGAVHQQQRGRIRCAVAISSVDIVSAVLYGVDNFDVRAEKLL